MRIYGSRFHATGCPETARIRTRNLRNSHLICEICGPIMIRRVTTTSEKTAFGPERAEEERISALSLRALAVGIACIVVTCLVVCYAELVVGKIQIGFLRLPPVVVGMLVLLLGVQALLTRFSERIRLKTHELFTIYIMMLLASMVSSRGILQKLIPLLVVPNYFATAGNGWKDKFGPSIPKWAVPFDPHGDAKQFVSARFFEALRPGEHIPWQLWILPLCAWSVFVALLFTAFLDRKSTRLNSS